MHNRISLAVVICLACQLLLVVGQLLLKRAMGQRIRGVLLALGILCLSFWFFLWVGLMSSHDLSKLYPFEGLNPALIALAAWLFLSEKMPAGAWLGLGLVCAGIAIVAST